MPRIGRRIYPGMKRAAWGFMQSGDFPVPVLHLKFGKNTGSVAYDSGSGKNDGVIEGASWVTGYLGPGLSFDYLDDYVKVSNVSMDGDRTLMIRFYPEFDYDDDLWHSFLYWLVDGNNKWWCQKRDTNVMDFHGPAGGTIFAIMEEKMFTARSWYTLLIERDETNDIAKMYFDNVLLGTDPSGIGTMTATLGNLFIGIVGAGRLMDGIIDEVMMFDEILTVAQKSQLYYGYG